MTPSDDLATLAFRVSRLEERYLRLKRIALAVPVLTLLAGGSALVLAGPDASKAGEGRPRVAAFDELTVGRLNIAGPDGVQRIVLSYQMPQAPFQGQRLERTVPPGMAGMIFCAPNGDEVGGIGISGAEKGGGTRWSPSTIATRRWRPSVSPPATPKRGRERRWW